MINAIAAALTFLSVSTAFVVFLYIDWMLDAGQKPEFFFYVLIFALLILAFGFSKFIIEKEPKK